MPHARHRLSARQTGKFPNRRAHAETERTNRGDTESGNESHTATQSTLVLYSHRSRRRRYRLHRFCTDVLLESVVRHYSAHGAAPAAWFCPERLACAFLRSGETDGSPSTHITHAAGYRW